jgi:hypothetical protein
MAYQAEEQTQEYLGTGLSFPLQINVQGGFHLSWSCSRSVGLELNRTVKFKAINE